MSGLEWESDANGQDSKFSVELVPTGIWKIDGEKGKWIMVLRITNRKTGQSLVFAPTHDDLCEGIVGLMLEAEIRNDLFKFKDPKLQPSRPTQFLKKLEQLNATVRQKKLDAISKGLVPGRAALSDWM